MAFGDRRSMRSLPQDFQNRELQIYGLGWHQIITLSAVLSTISFSNDVAIRLVSTANCYFKIGPASVTATVTDIFLPANVIERVFMHESNTLAAVVASGSGTLYATELF